MLSDEEAKAIKEVAKLGQKSLETADKAGSYLTQTFSGAIKIYAQAFEDNATGFRIRNRANVIRKTQDHLKKRGFETGFNEIPERNIIPLLESISLESDDEIQEVWARYISNAMDPTQISINVNRQIIEIIKRLEPVDLPILRILDLENLNEPRKDPIHLKVNDFDTSDESLVTIFARLAALGLFSFKNSGETKWATPDSYCKPCQLMVETTIGNFYVQPLLLEFQRSIRTQTPSGSGILK